MSKGKEQRQAYIAKGLCARCGGEKDCKQLECGTCRSKRAGYSRHTKNRERVHDANSIDFNLFNFDDDE